MSIYRRTFSCRIIPERGSWIELNITRKETICLRIDQSSTLPVTMFLRAFSPEFSTNAQILRAFYETNIVRLYSGMDIERIAGTIAVEDVVCPLVSEWAGEIIVESGQIITPIAANAICFSGIDKIEIMDEPKSKLLLNSLEEDKTKSHEEALERVYTRLRPGNEMDINKARELFHDKFFDMNRYRLGSVGRFRINRKFGLDIPLDEMFLTPHDIIQAVTYLKRLWNDDQTVAIDDLDHLGNRRVRTIDELASEELRKGFLKLRRTVQERMASRADDMITPRQFIDRKSISAAIEFFSDVVNCRKSSTKLIHFQCWHMNAASPHLVPAV